MDRHAARRRLMGLCELAVRAQQAHNDWLEEVKEHESNGDNAKEKGWAIYECSRAMRRLYVDQIDKFIDETYPLEEKHNSG